MDTVLLGECSIRVATQRARKERRRRRDGGRRGRKERKDVGGPHSAFLASLHVTNMHAFILHGFVEYRSIR